MSEDRRLLSNGYPANVSVRGVRFAMVDHLGGGVEILVSHAALDSTEAPDDNSGDYLARFDKHRAKFEQIASEKHSRGKIQDDGSITLLVDDV